MDEEMSKIANDLFDKAKSHLDSPIIGEIYTPLCLSCQNYIESIGFELPKCKKYGDIPKDIYLALSDVCLFYMIKPNCPEYDLPKIIKRKQQSK